MQKNVIRLLPGSSQLNVDMGGYAAQRFCVQVQILGFPKLQE